MILIQSYRDMLKLYLLDDISEIVIEYIKCCSLCYEFTNKIYKYFNDKQICTLFYKGTHSYKRLTIALLNSNNTFEHKHLKNTKIQDKKMYIELKPLEYDMWRYSVKCINDIEYITMLIIHNLSLDHIFHDDAINIYDYNCKNHHRDNPNNNHSNNDNIIIYILMKKFKEKIENYYSDIKLY